MKICPKCHLAGEFYLNIGRHDGFSVYCKDCQANYMAIRYRKDHPEAQAWEKHGQHNTPTYQCWADMKTRCDNPQNPSYQFYGGRGITYCKAWNLFSNFYRDMGDRPDGLSLDRVDNNGPYELANCRWATRSEQNLNKRYGPQKEVGPC